MAIGSEVDRGALTAGNGEILFDGVDGLARALGAVHHLVQAGQQPELVAHDSGVQVHHPLQLTAILESPVTIPNNESQANAMIVDGSALVNSLPPRSSKTFEDYAVSVVLPAIKSFSIKYKSTDIVLDVYQSSSLKAETRLKR